jgi:adiponectin receptor
MRCSVSKRELILNVAWGKLYIGIMYLFCSATLVLFLVPGFDRPRYRVFRGTSFVICGLSASIPIVHLEFFTDERYLSDFHSYPWALGGALYIFGAILYMMRVPERFSPGSFDIVVSPPPA